MNVPAHGQGNTPTKPSADLPTPLEVQRGRGNSTEGVYV
jgi:hypothetical protein